MKKILIIDYDQNSLTSLQTTFSGQGYQVVTAADGQTGWDKYNKESPDLVLMEAMLPKVHGFELCQRITSERNSQATVFIMTGVYKDRVYRTEALRTYGASEYFEKPLKMTELLASVEAVLGKPEPKPAEARPTAPPQAAAPVPSPVAAQPAHAPHAEARRPKGKSDDSIFDLPEDLDRLSREIPKTRKPTAPRPDPAAEQRFDAIADQLLKTVIVESSTAKTVQPKPAGGNGNGNGGGDIDQFLKSALADLDLNKDKVKVAKPAPKPPEPVQAKPAAPPVRPAAPEPKPTPPTPPPAPRAPEKTFISPPAPRAPEKTFTPPPTPRVQEKTPAAPPAMDMKKTLTPGDPGSDVSPFFTPDPAKPPKPVERAEKKTAPAPVHREVPRPEPVRPEPEKRAVDRPQPTPAAPKAEEARALAASTIFQDAVEPREKKGFPTLVAVGLGVVAVAAVGFILLRPKRPAPVVPPPQETSQQTAAVNTPTQPVEPPAAPVTKPAPEKKRPQPQAKPAEQPGASAILPTQETATALPLPGTRADNGAASPKTNPGTNTQAPGPSAAKTEEAAPPATKSETTTPQNQSADTSLATEPASPVVSGPAAAPAHEGDLVELGSVAELPKVVKKIDPIYPPAAQRVGREGNITVNALIDEKGNVIDTSILKGIQDDKGLGRAAETALKKWKFQPARKDGVAVKVWKPFVIAFKADANPAT